MATLMEVARRDSQIARMVADGLSNAEIGRQLGMDPSTVHASIGRLRKKYRIAGGPCSRVRLAVHVDRLRRGE